MDDARTGGTRLGGAGRSAGVALCLLVATALLTGCLRSSVDPPKGAGKLRFRDPVFTSATVKEDLAYGSAPGYDGTPETLRLDLYQPTGDPKTAKRPAIVWVHGGGFSGGTKDDQGPFGERFAKLGYVVVLIDYRLLAPGGCDGAKAGTAECVAAATGAIDDGKAAVRWLRRKAKMYRIDPDRIAIGGFSAGGVVATGVGVGSDVPGASGNPGFSSRPNAFFSVAGGLPAAEGVDRTDAPGYLFHGVTDPIIPYAWSKDTAEALDRAGVVAVLRQTEGGGHDVPPMEAFVAQTSNFLYQVLALGRR